MRFTNVNFSIPRETPKGLFILLSFGHVHLPRLGLIIPSSNTTMEPEFHKMLPNSFTVHVARLKLREVTVKGLIEMERGIEEEASKLADANVDVIGFGCTSGSLLKGLGYDKEIEKRIEKASMKPAVATAGALAKALNTLEIRNVAVVTPYIREINELERNFLEANGFNVIDLKGLGLRDNLKIGEVNSQTAYKLVLEVDYKSADGIFISCTNLRTIHVIEKLENKLKKQLFQVTPQLYGLCLKNAKFQ